MKTEEGMQSQPTDIVYSLADLTFFINQNDIFATQGTLCDLEQCVSMLYIPAAHTA